jgi:electron transfer flavoprotein beta subunit
MKVLACIKPVPDKESRLVIREDQTWIKDADLSFEISECDLYALEETLRIKEKHGGEAIVLSLGDDPANKILKTGLAMGADRAIQLKDEAFRGSDAFAVAKIIAQAVQKEGGVDVVMVGLQSDDLGAGQTGVVLAEFLKMPHVTVVIGLELSPEAKKAKARRELEGGMIEVVEVPLPAVFTIQFGINQPRYASLKGIMQAKKKELKVWGLKDLGLQPSEVGRAGSMLEPLRVFFPEQKSKVEIIGGSPDEAAAKLVEKLRKEAKVL